MKEIKEEGTKRILMEFLGKTSVRVLDQGTERKSGFANELTPDKKNYDISLKIENFLKNIFMFLFKSLNFL
jgi:hypothetical protein